MNSVLVILNVLHFLNDGVRTVFLSLLPFMAKDLHLNFIQIGTLSAILGAILALLSLPAGYLAGKFGGFKVIIVGLLCYSLGALVVGFSINFFILALAFTLAALGYGSYHTVSNLVIARISDIKNFGSNLSNTSAFGDSGRTLLPVAAIFLTSLVGWRDTFFIVAGCGLVVFAMTQLWTPLKNHVVNEKMKKHKQSYKEWFAELPMFFRHKRLLLIIVTSLMDNLASSPVFVFFPFLLLAKGFSAASLGIFIASFFIGSLIGKLVIGRAVDMFGSARMFILAEYLMAATLIFLTFSYNFFLLLGICFLLGAFTRGTSPIINVFYTEISHEEHYDKVFGIGETMVGVGITVAPLIAGMIADTYGVVSFFYMAAVFALLATIPIFILLKRNALNKMHIAPAMETE